MGLNSRFTPARRWFAVLTVILLCLPVFCGNLLGAEQGEVGSTITLNSRDAALASPQAKQIGPERYRVFLLRHISPQDGKRFLTDVNITTASQVNDSNMLLVTASQEALVKAAALLALVDSREEYAVKMLMPVSEASQMPTNDAIQAEISNSGTPVSIGTFLVSSGVPVIR